MFTCLKLPDSNEVSGLFYKTTLASFRDTNGIQTMYHVCHDQKTLIVALQRNGAKSMYLAFGELEICGDLSSFVRM